MQVHCSEVTVCVQPPRAVMGRPQSVGCAPSTARRRTSVVANALWLSFGRAPDSSPAPLHLVLLLSVARI